ncbi:hypothetical protein S479_22435 [Salmonella enterica subsp. enterica serovar Newport]|nr:hypothetical protein [Salmonella enterica subsp. enterica serovar Newport]
MVLVHGQNPEGDYFTINNNSPEPVFIKVSIANVKIEKNIVNEVNYDKGNISNWGVTANPSIFILDPNESRKILVNEVSPNSVFDTDQIYAISFLPSSTNNASTGNLNSMSLQIGFKVYFILPAKVSRVQYDIKYDKNSGLLNVNNTGNTLISLDIDNCSQVNIESKKNTFCSTTLITMAGRSKSYNLPRELRSSTLRASVTNYNKSYLKQIIIGD